MKNSWWNAVSKIYLRTVLCAVLGIVVYLSFSMLAAVFGDSEGQLSPTVSLVFDIVSLLFELVLFVCFVYSTAWDIGNRHRNAVQFGHLAEDRAFGLKAALLASVPALIAYGVLIADKWFGLWEGYLALYRIANVALYPIMVWCFGVGVQATTADVSWTGVLLSGLPMLVTPIVCAVAYRLGYADIVLSDRLVYKRKK